MPKYASFKELVEKSVDVLQMNREVREVFGSIHMRTKRLNSPGMISHRELLELESLLGMDAYLIYNSYGAGSEVLSKLEVAQLKFIHNARKAK